MKHSINLYRPDLIPKRPILDFERLLVAIIIVWVIGIGMRVVLEARGLALNNQVQSAQTQLNQKQQTMQQLAGQVAQLQIDPVLERRVENLRTEVAKSRSVLSEFRAIGAIQSFDYAAILTELATIHEDGIWLTQINERNGVLSLQGYVTEPALVARWVQKFDDTTNLGQRQFGRIQMTRQENDSLQFSLQGVDYTHPGFRQRSVQPENDDSGEPTVEAVENDETAATSTSRRFLGLGG
ncbi:PilN domain-containing protein [Aliidiomarina haloalkalitolerans]|uniref:MSHA biogenesis protein MshI n=1 Tax=Aliidiomarina haloalkalitolerans TaxID=859059 RepID=A0A432VPN2_9GAMM|nr:PilN domain-containing protein [Aliidiomarina haloalkalitolerans]RUO18081.1 hypothetical protein CWE06_11950 [Aliidiomarina haloalkalitolerans]